MEIPFKYEDSFNQRDKFQELVESERILLHGLQNAGVKGTYNWLSKLIVEISKKINQHVTSKFSTDDFFYSLFFLFFLFIQMYSNIWIVFTFFRENEIVAESLRRSRGRSGYYTPHIWKSKIFVFIKFEMLSNAILFPYYNVRKIQQYQNNLFLFFDKINTGEQIKAFLHTKYQFLSQLRYFLE